MLLSHDPILNFFIQVLRIYKFIAFYIIVIYNFINFYINNPGETMNFNETIINFKDQRTGKKKKPVNVTVEKERIERIEGFFSEQSPYFKMLNKAEKLDFMIFMLEKYMFPNN